MDYIETFLAINKYAKKYDNFLKIYEIIFSKFDKPITLVEVGVFQGGSLEFWQKVLPQGSRIIGIEINPLAVKIKIKNTEIVIGNQESNEFWESFYSIYDTIDVLIDDGGHTNKQQIITCINAIKYLKDNSLLIVEDTHFSYDREVGNPHKYSFINWVKYCIDCLNLRFENSHNLDFFDETKNIVAKRVKSISIFESLVYFEINQNSLPKKICAGSPVDVDFKQYRNLKFSEAENIIPIKLKKFKLYNQIKITISKKLQMLIYKIENYKLKRYFDL